MEMGGGKVTVKLLDFSPKVPNSLDLVYSFTAIP